EQDQQRLALVVDAGAVGAEQEFHRLGAVAERHDRIVDAGAADVLLDQAGVAFVVLDHHDLDRALRYHRAHATLLLSTDHRRGSRTVNVLPLPSSELSPMLPPRRRTSARTCASPMPSPGRS